MGEGVFKINISIIGSGYVGTVTGSCLAKLGNNVTIVDIDKEKINKIKQGKTPIYEENLQEILKKNLSRIKATTDYEEPVKNSDVTFICVGTPSKSNGDIDLSYVKNVIVEIGKNIQKKDKWHLVVVKSTVVPGITKNVLLPILEKHAQKKPFKDFGLAMNPEFLREGKAVKDFLKPDRVIIGSEDEKSKRILREIYKKLKCPILETDLTTAEMIKYASNCFLATKISFINEIGNMCKNLKIDTYDVAEGMGLDKRIQRSFLNAGIGWGGSCFPKDSKALHTWGKNKKQDVEIIGSAIKVNDKQPLKTIQLLKKYIPSLKNKTIGLLGLAFKPDTDDTRESRSIPIVEKLLAEKASVKVYDPKAMINFKKIFPDINYCHSAQEVLDADAVIIATKWDEFEEINYTGKIVIDGRRLKKAEETAEIYEGVCW